MTAWHHADLPINVDLGDIEKRIETILSLHDLGMYDHAQLVRALAMIVHQAASTTAVQVLDAVSVRPV